ncbi:MAG: hypothetical protein M1812_001826 [Candelaria pacifica]|nr:MAG: hypothetical protein M1812_001826 [Candelaria pacifica]
MAKHQLFLFGGGNSWSSGDWTASDDRVRGGKSQSYLDCSPNEPTAKFHGNLDIKTLGGAGFASQRTTGEERSWDLSAYDGIELDLVKADEKQYTLILKDELLPPNPDNGREQSTISYEYDFRFGASSAKDKSTKLFVPWSDFKATYRGREQEDAPSLERSTIKRFSLMMRSFFGDQEGHFSLYITSISAVKNASNSGTDLQEYHSHFPLPYSDEEKAPEAHVGSEDTRMSSTSANQGLMSWIWETCTVS